MEKILSIRYLDKQDFFLPEKKAYHHKREWIVAPNSVIETSTKNQVKIVLKRLTKNFAILLIKHLFSFTFTCVPVSCRLVNFGEEYTG